MLYTERLRLRPCQSDDLVCLHQLWTEADVRRFLFDNRRISKEEAREFIEASAANFINHGYGIWLFFKHEDDLLAGFAGFLPSPFDLPNLIFGTQPQLWGRGYAKEAANALLHHAFDGLGIERVVADVDEPNSASIRVLEALGMSRTGRGIVNGRALLYYEIHAR